MKRKLVVSIIKNEHMLGNILLSWENLNFLNSIQKTMDIIYNYNRNLIRADLPEEIFALRMLQEENKWGTENMVRAKMMDNSNEYVRFLHSEYFEDEDPFAITDEYGTIAITEIDMKENLENAEIHARIDLDKMEVEFYQGVRVYSYTGAKSKFGIDVKKLPVLTKELSRSNASARLNKVYFNVLSDFYDFVRASIDGWVVDGETSYCIVPVD